MHRFAISLALIVSAFSANAQGGNADFDESWWATTSGDGVQRINIRCGIDFFDPRRIVVKANVPVELSVSTTTGLASHSFVITVPSPKAVTLDAPVGPMQKAFTFVPGLTGHYQAVCRDNALSTSTPSQKGKQGVLIVIP